MLQSCKDPNQEVVDGMCISFSEPEQPACVRDNPEGRFLFENNIIHDTRTDLMWSKDLGRRKTWEEAKSYCKNLYTG